MRTPRIYLDFAASEHAERRIGERTKLNVGTVVQSINSGRAISLNNPSNHSQGRAYFLLYSEQDACFFVAVAAPGKGPRAQGDLVTLLTQAQYENDRGAIAPSRLVSAVKCALPHQAYMDWKRRNQRGPKRAEIAVVLTYVDLELRARSVRLTAPKVPREHITENGLDKIADHPDFWPWLRARLFARPEADGDQIVSRLTGMHVEAPGIPPIELLRNLEEAQ